MKRYHNAVCMRCPEPGCDREPLPGWYMHSGCLVIWLVFAAEMGCELADVPGILRTPVLEEGPGRWIPDENERSGELDIGESAY